MLGWFIAYNLFWVSVDPPKLAISVSQEGGAEQTWERQRERERDRERKKEGEKEREGERENYWEKRKMSYRARERERQRCIWGEVDLEKFKKPS